MSENARFSARDIVALLSQAELDQHVCIVGGQALNIWAEFFARELQGSRRLAPLTSKDLDVFGQAKDAREVATPLDGKLSLPTLEDHTASTAVALSYDRLDERYRKLTLSGMIVRIETKRRSLMRSALSRTSKYKE